MPIKIEFSLENPICQGHRFFIDDEDKLAKLVGEVLLGKHRHVAKILYGENPILSANYNVNNINKIVGILGNVKTPTNRYHRDGWIFQHIAWIAAKKIYKNGLMKAPHSQPADKGLDNLIIELEANNQSVKAFIICEDKATEDTRTTIRAKIWPEFKEYESQSRDNEIISDLTVILESNESKLGFNLDEYLEKLFLTAENKHYNISITTDSEDEQAYRKSVFGGYENIVAGKIERRKGNTIHIDNLRVWMDNFSGKITSYLRSKIV